MPGSSIERRDDEFRRCAATIELSEARHHDTARPHRLPSHRRLRSRIPHDRSRARRTRRPSSCCMKASARPGCGAIFRTGCRPRPALACSSIRAPAMAPRRRSSCRGRSTTCISRRSRCCRSCSTRIGFRRGLLLGHSDGASIAAIYAGGVSDHRVRGVAMIAPHFVVEDVSVASIAEIKTGL